MREGTGHFSRHDVGGPLHPKDEDGTGAVAAFDFMKCGANGSKYHGRRGSEAYGYKLPSLDEWWARQRDEG
jgi:hypothetical protein